MGHTVMSVESSVISYQFFSIEDQCERRPMSRFALHAQLASHPPRQVSADRETKPRPLRRLRERAVQLHERLEDCGATIERDPDASVDHADVDMAFIVVGSYAHVTAGQIGSENYFRVADPPGTALALGSRSSSNGG